MLHHNFLEVHHGLERKDILGEHILFNIASEPAQLEGTGASWLPFLQSATICDSYLVRANQVIDFDCAKLGLLVQSPWEKYSNGLYFLPRQKIGNWNGSPSQLTGALQFCPQQDFSIYLMFWSATAQTECGIHSEHSFFETHLQLMGEGVMQKFRTPSGSPYETVPMVPGGSHRSFCTFDLDRGFVYPWHQYHARTQCIWAAIEFHPKNGR